MYIKDQFELLSRILVGSKIVAVYRCFYDTDSSHIDIDKRDQELDGNLILKLDKTNHILFFEPVAELFTIRFSITDENNFINSNDLTSNYFWKNYVNREIRYIELFYEYNIENPSGFRIKFDNDKTIVIKYISENEYTFDALIITT